MTKINFLLLFTVLTVLGAGKVIAQSTVSVSASAYLITPITVSRSLDMSFGNFAVNATTGGTIVLSPSGVRTTTGGVTLPSATGTVNAATFTVFGEGNYTYDITLPSSPVTLTDGSGHTMTMGSFTSSPSATSGALTSGSQTLYVGATLTVSAGQVSGTYTTATPFNVTVNYN